jgi:hypothetical protein
MQYMPDFLRSRSFSLFTVLLMLLLIVAAQGGISYTITFGRLDSYIPMMKDSVASVSWLALRLVVIGAAIALWLLKRKRGAFQAVIVTNSILTIGLVVNMLALLGVLSGYSSEDVRVLLTDVVLMAVTNVLIFSIWYWVIDPPGVEDAPREDAPWDFLFPQRAASVPKYEQWAPRYTDYLYVAFTTSFAFSPTDTMPLTRRAKLLMLLQALISIITLTGIAGSAINILAGAR